MLEERLNNKKEELLEKELILDEVTNLAEKLRKQALEGRQASLELSERVAQLDIIPYPAIAQQRTNQTKEDHASNDVNDL